jgi:predicted DNA-binding antitoxin AbrB/MazE fold protein
MIIHTDAIFIDGVLRLKQPVALPEGAEVRLAIETAPATPKSIAPPMPADPLAAVIG